MDDITWQWHLLIRLITVYDELFSFLEPTSVLLKIKQIKKDFFSRKKCQKYFKIPKYSLNRTTDHPLSSRLFSYSLPDNVFR